MVGVVTLYRKSAEEAPWAFKRMIIGTASVRLSESDEAKKENDTDMQKYLPYGFRWVQNATSRNVMPETLWSQ